jgi:hypothetical protein
MSLRQEPVLAKKQASSRQTSIASIMSAVVTIPHRTTAAGVAKDEFSATPNYVRH